VAQLGRVIGTASSGFGPVASAFDQANGLTYVANEDSDNITLLNGTAVAATIFLTAYTFPDGIAYDPANGTVYVSDGNLAEVTVLEGTRIVANVSVGALPVGIAYDAANGWMYVACSDSNEVSVINGTRAFDNVTVGIGPIGVAYDVTSSLIVVTNNLLNTLSFVGGLRVVHTSLTQGSPNGVICDPENSFVYVANTANNTVGIYAGYGLLAVLKVGSVPWGMGYDPLNGLVYVANSNSNTLSVINWTTMVGKISVGPQPYSVSFDPTTGHLLVADFAGDSVSVVSTALWVESPSVHPLGHPAGSADVGENVTFLALLVGIGTGGINATMVVTPDTGFGCAAWGSVMYDNGTAVASASCRPTAAGDYTLTFQIVDSSDASVWSQIGFTVYPAPESSVPIARFQGEAASINSSDIGQRITFTATVTGGTGISEPYNWTGITKANCSDLTTSEPTCSFPAPVVLDVQAAYNDSNGRRTVSPVLVFPVFPLPNATAPTVYPVRVDVGQIVTYSEVPTGGSGIFPSYLWAGLPASGGCTGVITAHPRCTLTTAGTNAVSVEITDSNGESAQSPVATFYVDPLPYAQPPVASRATLDTGQTVTFTTIVSGGSGGFSYAWTGLPDRGCYGLTSSSPTCSFAKAGPVAVRVTVTDSNGGVSPPSGADDLLVQPQPVVGAPTIRPSVILPGQAVQINVSVTGGAGGLRYAWSGLPSGCTGTTASLSCAPTAVGYYDVAVSVTDANGYRANSTASSLEITNALPTLFGASPILFYGVIIGVIVVVAAVLIVRRSRRKAREPPPPPENWTPDDPWAELARRRQQRRREGGR
jgi:YVTN family beta-propeller protein